MATATAILDTLRNQLDTTEYKKLHWEGSFTDYLTTVLATPGVTRTAYQRLYDMILSHGVEDVYENKDKIPRFKFFTEFAARHGDGIYGLDRPLMQLVNTFKSAALGYGTERRVILLHGPVGSAKSTIARLLKRGLEEYSRTDAGMLFSFAWKNADGTWAKDPMHSEPLQLVPEEHRPQLLASVNDQCQKPHPYGVMIKGDLSPYSRYEYKTRLAKYDGDWLRMLDNEVKVYRLVLSEKDRIGIGTFQPKDEKNQDSTELTGDINYRKIAEYGSDSDPRAFSFDGELNIANRGIVEFIEVLKLDVAFLYDLLGASQEHKIKPKKFAQTDIDEVILGHTNEPEYKRLQNNEFMEALRDRTVKIDIPYVTRLRDEVKIYEKDFNSDRVRGKHIAPHTVEVAAMWAVLTRPSTPA
jgi:serine protein kinase